MAHFTLQFCPQANVLGESVDFAKMTELLCVWNTHDTDILSVQSYTDDEELRVEVRLYRTRDPNNSDDAQGFIVKSSWWAWFFGEAPDEDVGHNHPDGYLLSDANLMRTVPYVFRNYCREIVRGKHKCTGERYFHKNQRYTLREFNRADENAFIKRLE